MKSYQQTSWHHWHLSQDQASCRTTAGQLVSCFTFRVLMNYSDNKVGGFRWVKEDINKDPTWFPVQWASQRWSDPSGPLSGRIHMKSLKNTKSTFFGCLHLSPAISRNCYLTKKQAATGRSDLIAWLCWPTFSLHANDPVRAEPLTTDFLLQVKHPSPINLLIWDAVIMVPATGTGPLKKRGDREKKKRTKKRNWHDKGKNIKDVIFSYHEHNNF